MRSEMTSKQRMLTAIKGGIPDRVPVAPDISSMIPCRLAKRPFWDIHLFQNPYPPSEYTNPALGRAYLEAAEYYGIDAWYMYGDLKLKTDSAVDYSMGIVSKAEDKILHRTTMTTPAGELYEEDLFYTDNSPVKVVKRIKNLKEDFSKLRYFYPNISGYDNTESEQIKRLVGDRGIFCFIMGIPGFQDWIFSFDGGLEQMVYDYYDYPELIDELIELQHKFLMRQTEMMLDAKPDVLFIGASGALTLQSEEQFRHMALPSLKKITKMAREADIPTMMHACGRASRLVHILACETDLDCINPLEPPLMGDCDLAYLKKNYGKKLCLMGNLHTTEVMYLGDTKAVELAAKKAIDDAADGGGFILSTGDQCGRDTPDANIFKLAEVAKSYGKY